MNKVKVLSAKNIVAWFILVLVYLVSAYSTSYVWGKRTDSHLREEMLKNIQILAMSLENNNLKALDFQPDDNELEEFIALSNHFKIFAQLYNFRGVYTLAEKSGKLLFGPESYSPDDEYASPPGTIYEQPTNELKAFFDNPISFTEGPVQDEYGVFVSAFVPIFDAEHNLVMALGVDVEASEWERLIHNSRIKAVSITSLIFVLLVIIAFNYHKPVFVIFFGVLITVSMYFTVNHIEDEQEREVFSALADSHFRDVQGALKKIQKYLIITAEHFAGNGHISEVVKFRKSIEILTDDSSIHRLIWIPVSESESLIFQEIEQKFAGFKVWSKDDYSRESWIESLNEMQGSPVIIDHYSELPGDDDVYENLVEFCSDSEFIILSTPIEHEEPDNIRGILLGTISLDEIIDSVNFNNSLMGRSLLRSKLEILRNVDLNSSEKGKYFKNSNNRKIYPINIFNDSLILSVNSSNNFDYVNVRIGTLLALLFGSIITALAVTIAILLKQKRRNLRKIVKEQRSDIEVKTNRLKGILDYSELMVSELDLDGKYVYVSKSTSEYIGVNDDELIGRYSWNFVSDDYGKLFKERIEKIKLEKITIKVEDVIEIDEKSYYIQSVLFPILDEKGDIKGIGTVSHDITREKESELMEEEYRQAQKLEAVGQLSGGIAHDINNFLTPIIGNSEILITDADLNKDDLVLLNHINLAAQKIRELVSRLLSFSRKNKVEKVKCSVEKLLSGIEPLIKRMVRQNIRLKFEHLSKDVHILCDITQIEQVVINLIINAQDAMPEGGVVTITTDLHKSEDGRNYATIEVRDHGTGINPEIIPNLFVPFFTNKPKEFGTGLGLTVCYGIVKQHGGYIKVWSELEKGSSFKVFLPLYDESGFCNKSHSADTNISVVTTANSDAILSEKTENLVSPPKRKIKVHKAPFENSNNSIIVVDDEVMVRDLAAVIVKRLGYNPVKAANGEQAMDIMKKSNGEILAVLTDIVMPEMNGYELDEAVSELYPETKVIFMTGHSDRVLKDHGHINVEDRLIRKPFNSNDVKAILNRIIYSKVP